jgi:colicin import membrane protein
LSDEKIELSSEFTDTDFEFKTGGSSEKGNQTMNTIFPSDNKMTADEQKKIVEKWAFFDRVDLDKRKAENMQRAAVVRMQKAKEAQARDDKAHKKLEAENAVAESKAKAAKDAAEANRIKLAREAAKAAEAKKRADAADKIKTDAAEAAAKIKKDALAARMTADAKSAAVAKLKAPEAAAAKLKADAAAKAAKTLPKAKISAAH